MSGDSFYPPQMAYASTLALPAFNNGASSSSSAYSSRQSHHSVSPRTSYLSPPHRSLLPYLTPLSSLIASSPTSSSSSSRRPPSSPHTYPHSQTQTGGPGGGGVGTRMEFCKVRTYAHQPPMTVAMVQATPSMMTIDGGRGAVRGKRRIPNLPAVEVAVGRRKIDEEEEKIQLPIWPRCSDSSRHALIVYFASSSCTLFHSYCEIRTVGSTLDHMLSIASTMLDAPTDRAPFLYPIAPSLSPSSFVHAAPPSPPASRESLALRTLLALLRHFDASGRRFASDAALVRALEDHASIHAALGQLYPKEKDRDKRSMFQSVFEYLTSADCKLFALAKNEEGNDEDERDNGVNATTNDIERLIDAGGYGRSSKVAQASSPSTLSQSEFGELSSPSSSSLSSTHNSSTLLLLQALDARDAHFDHFDDLIHAVVAERLRAGQARLDRLRQREVLRMNQRLKVVEYFAAKNLAQQIQSQSQSTARAGSPTNAGAIAAAAAASSGVYFVNQKKLTMRNSELDAIIRAGNVDVGGTKQRSASAGKDAAGQDEDEDEDDLDDDDPNDVGRGTMYELLYLLDVIEAECRIEQARETLDAVVNLGASSGSGSGAAALNRTSSTLSVAAASATAMANGLVTVASITPQSYMPAHLLAPILGDPHQSALAQINDVPTLLDALRRTSARTQAYQHTVRRWLNSKQCTLFVQPASASLSNLDSDPDAGAEAAHMVGIATKLARESGRIETERKNRYRIMRGMEPIVVQQIVVENENSDQNTQFNDGDDESMAHDPAIRHIHFDANSSPSASEADPASYRSTLSSSPSSADLDFQFSAALVCHLFVSSRAEFHLLTYLRQLQSGQASTSGATKQFDSIQSLAHEVASMHQSAEREKEREIARDAVRKYVESRQCRLFMTINSNNDATATTSTPVAPASSRPSPSSSYSPTPSDLDSLLHLFHGRAHIALLSLRHFDLYQRSFDSWRSMMSAVVEEEMENRMDAVQLGGNYRMKSGMMGQQMDEAQKAAAAMAATSSIALGSTIRDAIGVTLSSIGNDSKRNDRSPVTLTFVPTKPSQLSSPPPVTSTTVRVSPPNPDSVPLVVGSPTTAATSSTPAQPRRRRPPPKPYASHFLPGCVRLGPMHRNAAANRDDDEADANDIQAATDRMRQIEIEVGEEDAIERRKMRVIELAERDRQAEVNHERVRLDAEESARALHASELFARNNPNDAARMLDAENRRLRLAYLVTRSRPLQDEEWIVRDPSQYGTGEVHGPFATRMMAEWVSKGAIDTNWMVSRIMETEDGSDTMKGSDMMGMTPSSRFNSRHQRKWQTIGSRKEFILNEAEKHDQAHKDALENARNSTNSDGGVNAIGGVENNTVGNKTIANAPATSIVNIINKRSSGVGSVTPSVSFHLPPPVLVPSFPPPIASFSPPSLLSPIVDQYEPVHELDLIDAATAAAADAAAILAASKLRNGSGQPMMRERVSQFASARSSMNAGNITGNSNNSSRKSSMTFKRGSVGVSTTGVNMMMTAMSMVQPAHPSLLASASSTSISSSTSPQSTSRGSSSRSSRRASTLLEDDPDDHVQPEEAIRRQIKAEKEETIRRREQYRKDDQQIEDDKIREAKARTEPAVGPIVVMQKVSQEKTFFAT